MSARPRPVVNVTTIEVAPDRGSPSGFPTHRRQLGESIGAELLGGTVYELDPGERNGPYQYEIGNEGCMLVLTGTPTLRHPHGRDELAVGDMVAFPEGADGAHQLINESTSVARVLILSTKRDPSGTADPDSSQTSWTIGEPEKGDW